MGLADSAEHPFSWSLFMSFEANTSLDVSFRNMTQEYSPAPFVSGLIQSE